MSTNVHFNIDGTQQIQHNSDNGSQHNATQCNKTDTTQWIATQRNTTDTTQQNSPQHNKPGNENHAHMLNKPVEVSLSSTKNSTEKNSQKTLQVYTV